MTAKQAITHGLLFQNAQGEWCKKCPECSKEQSYAGIKNAIVCVRRNSMCGGCAQTNSNKLKNEKRVAQIQHEEKAKTVVETVLMQKPEVIIINPYTGCPHFGVGMYPVTLTCECNYSTKRKVPVFPFRILWYCPRCSTPHKTTFELLK